MDRENTIIDEIHKIRKFTEANPTKFTDSIGVKIEPGQFVCFANGKQTISIGVFLGYYYHNSNSIPENNDISVCFVSSSGRMSCLHKKRRGIIAIPPSAVDEKIQKRYTELYKHCFVDKLLNFL